jgi:fimbrial chaperone protein
MMTRRIIALFAAFAALSPIACYAMRVTPIQLELLSTGSGSRGSVTVSNNSSEPLPVEVTVQRITQDENANRRYSPGGESEFLILPPQALLAPGASQVFRVQWVGEPLLAQSESFILYISQVPVRSRGNRNATVQVVLSIGCMVNVAPPRGVADLKILAAGVESEKNGKHRPFVLVYNPTNVHALLPQSRLRIWGRGWSKDLSGADIAQMVGIGLVQPGMRRKFVLPIDLPDGVSDIQAVIQFKPVRS